MEEVLWVGSSVPLEVCLACRASIVLHTLYYTKIFAIPDLFRYIRVQDSVSSS